MKPIYGKKRYLVLVLVSVFIAVAALAPFLLSSPPALHYFLTSVNKKIPGRLSIDSWLIGWQQGVLCRNVVYSAPEKGITVSIPSLASNRGLLELMLAPKNFGTVHVDSPLVELSRRSIQEFIANGKTTAAEMDKGSGAAGDEAPVWDQVVMELKARGGQVKSVWDDQDFVIALTNVSVDSSLAAGIASYDIGFRAMEQGFVEAVGTLNLPVHERGWFETIIVDAAVKFSSLPLADVLRAGATLSSLPQGKGVMKADLQIKVAGLDHIEFSGLTELSDVSLHGGFLGDDQPSFRQFHLAVEQGRWTGSEWSFKVLELVSDTLQMKVSRETAPGKMQLTGQGTINLPVLFDQIPRLLKVNESVFVETGFLDFTVDMERSPNPSIRFKAKADTIGGIFEDQRFAWESPVSLLFNGEKNGAELRVSALQFDAPFARVKGSGDLHSFVLDGEMDIDRALSDVGMLFQVDWSGAGRMALLAQSGPVEDNDNRLQIDAALDIDDFILRRHDKPVAPLHMFSLNGELRIPNTFFDHGTGELDLQVVLSSWLGEFFLVMNGEKSGDRPFRPFYTTDVEIDLDQLSTLLATSAVSDKWPVIGGAMQLQAAGLVGETGVEIRDLSAEVTNFAVQGSGTVFAGPRIHLQVMQPVNEEVPFLSVRELEVAADKDRFFRDDAGRNMVDFSKRKIILHNVRLQGESVSASVDSLVVPDWREPFQGMDSQFSLSQKPAGMDEGGFEFVAGDDPAADTAVVKTSGSSQALTGLKLSDPLVAFLLSWTHPLFGGLAQPSGLVDVRLDSLWWPMGEGKEDEADFVVIFDVGEIHLESKNQLKDLLALFGLEKETLQLRDNNLYCIGKQGRIKCSPVRVLVGDAEIVLSGFVGMDGSLAYEIDVPVTGKIRDAAGARIPEGAGVKVAVKGTTGEPTFDKEAVASKIQGLAEQAANETTKKNNGT